MNNEENGEILDRAISEIRDETIDPAAVSEAAERVWAKVSAEAARVGATAGEIEAIRSCADFQSLIPEWRRGRLPEARAMLVEDHIHACPACRRAAADAREPLAMIPKRARPPVWRWAVAAALIAAGCGSDNSQPAKASVTPTPVTPALTGCSRPQGRAPRLPRSRGRCTK